LRKVRWGVIGLGWFGEHHCAALSGIPNVELHSLCTRTEERLAELGGRFGVASTTTDYREMLADPDLDAVSITTHWRDHATPALAALAAGKHVFCEKPMASTIEECQAMVGAAREADGHFMVGHICRFNPRYALAQREIREGKIGRVVSMYARRNIPGTRSAVTLRKIGPIVADGVHDMDLMMWMTGARPVSVYARGVFERNLPNPDVAWSMFEFDNGAIGVLENAWFLMGHGAVRIDERLEIIGTEGSAHVQESAPSLLVIDRDGPAFPDTTYWPQVRGITAGALRDELRYFADCIQTGTAPDVISPEESMAAVTACLAAEESLHTGAKIDL